MKYVGETQGNLYQKTNKQYNEYNVFNVNIVSENVEAALMVIVVNKDMKGWYGFCSKKCDM